MNQKALHTLEYDKIIQKLEQQADSLLGKEYCKKLLPLTDLADIEKEQRETSDALTHLLTQGSISFQGTLDVRESLKRLEIGAILGTGELLAIAKLLNNTGSVKAYFRRTKQAIL
jgi:DNA mismatch repair protein MutS2